MDIIKEKNQERLVLYGILSYEPKCFTNCGCKYEENNIVDNGFGVPLKISLLKISTYLRLKKKRYKCKECNSKFCEER